jgi:hypothetical protein
VIYSGLDPVTGRPGKTPPVEIRLLTQDAYADNAAREYRNERILQLSPDGRYLLVGTRATCESSLAELYRTADGKLIHYWAPGQLTGLVTSIGSSDCFADASLAGNSIRLISWETGEIEREIQVPGRVTGLCGVAGGQELLASIDGKSITRYNANTGALVRTIGSSLQPVANSPDGKVFIGYLPETDTTGSMLLADGQTGDVLAVLSRGTRRDTAAQFASDGQSFMLGSNVTTSDLVRNISPDEADRMLDSSGNVVATAAPDDSILELPTIKVFPTLSNQSAATSYAILDATDMAKLTASIGTKATIQGMTTATALIRSRNALVISFGEPGKCFNVFVPPKPFGVLNARFGGALDAALNHKVLRVTGIIVIYRALPEIVLNDAAQIQLVDTPASAAPAQ